MSLVYAYEMYADQHLADLRQEARLEALRDEARLAAPRRATWLSRLAPIGHALRMRPRWRGIRRRLAMS